MRTNIFGPLAMSEVKDRRGELLELNSYRSFSGLYFDLVNRALKLDLSF